MMLYNRGKPTGAETPSRQTHPVNKLHQLLGSGKHSDPFMRELKEVYDKENINPNVKETRVKSQTQKTESHQDHKSPARKKMLLRNPRSKGRKQSESGSKGAAHGSNKLASSKKSLVRQEPVVRQFQDEYYSAQEQRRERKMKVTLKDLKKQRKSMQQEPTEMSFNSYNYGKAFQTKDSIHQQQLESHHSQNLQKQSIRHQPSVKMKTDYSDPPLSDRGCINHPRKKATHHLVDNSSQMFCEKCALILATQGHKMIQLEAQEERGPIREKRLNQLKDIMFELDRLEPSFMRAQGQLNAYRDALTARFEQQDQQLNRYFNKMREEVELAHQKSLFNLKIYYEALFEQLQRCGQALGQAWKESQSIKEDIMPNINSIVSIDRVSQESFTLITQNHMAIVHNSEDKIRSLDQLERVCYICNFSEVEQWSKGNLHDRIKPKIDKADCFPVTARPASRNQQAMHYRWSFGKEVMGMG